MLLSKTDLVTDFGKCDFNPTQSKWFCGFMISGDLTEGFIIKHVKKSESMSFYSY